MCIRDRDCSLQLDYMKLESLVIADQNVAVNTFPGLVHTARHTMGVSNCLLYTSIGAEKKLLSETGNPGKAYLVQTANGGIFRRRTEKGIILICRCV